MLISLLEQYLKHRTTWVEITDSFLTVDPTVEAIYRSFRPNTRIENIKAQSVTWNPTNVVSKKHFRYINQRRCVIKANWTCRTSDISVSALSDWAAGTGVGKKARLPAEHPFLRYKTVWSSTRKTIKGSILFYRWLELLKQLFRPTSNSSTISVSPERRTFQPPSVCDYIFDTIPMLGALVMLQSGLRPLTFFGLVGV